MIQSGCEQKFVYLQYILPAEIAVEQLADREIVPIFADEKFEVVGILRKYRVSTND